MESWTWTYKSIAWMDALTAFMPGNLDDPITVEVRIGLSQVDRERRAERMLRCGVRVRVDRCRAYAGL